MLACEALTRRPPARPPPTSQAQGATRDLPSQEEPLGESQTVSACGMPSELYAIMLQRVVIADAAGVPASALTEEQLAKACSSPEAQAGDIIVLAGCRQIRNLSCLVRLESTHTLDISGCTRMDAATVPIAGLK